MNPALVRTILKDRGLTFCVTDPDLRVIEAEDVMGLLPQGAINLSLFEIIPELKGHSRALSDLLTGKQKRFELIGMPCTTREGENIYSRFIAFPHTGPHDEIAGLIILIQIENDNDRPGESLVLPTGELDRPRKGLKRSDHPLQATRAELRSFDEMKAKFIALASHELRSPLTVIAGYLELLLDGDADRLNKLQRDYLKIIQNSTRQLLATTNDLLDLMRLDAGRVELILQPTDLAALLRTVIADRIPEVEARGQQLAVEITEDLPLVLCDRLRARQILGNLITNAIHCTPPGGHITITLEQAPEANNVVIGVQDGNISLAPAEPESTLGKLVARSSNASPMMQEGLGLQIARALARLHGGKVWIENPNGQGVTVYVSFPIPECHLKSHRS